MWPWIASRIRGLIPLRMSETYVQVPPDSSGKMMRALRRTAGALSGICEEVMIAESYGHNWAVASGGGTINLVSGQVVLHSVAINDRTSGMPSIIFDSSSGAAGNRIAYFFAPSRAIPPSYVLLDCTMYSGIVVSQSGATWHITVTYRRTLA